MINVVSCSNVLVIETEKMAEMPYSMAIQTILADLQDAHEFKLRNLADQGISCFESGEFEKITMLTEHALRLKTSLGLVRELCVLWVRFDTSFRTMEELINKYKFSMPEPACSISSCSVEIRLLLNTAALMKVLTSAGFKAFELQSWEDAAMIGKCANELQKFQQLAKDISNHLAAVRHNKILADLAKAKLAA